MFEFNRQTNSLYGQSPIQLLADVIVALVYGVNYNLDFYQNANMPEGIVSVLGANNDQIRTLQERLSSVARQQDPQTGLMRRIGYRFGFSNTEVKFTPFQLAPREMEIIAQQQWFTKLLWACFGVTADEMGFTENSNRAVGEEQTKVNARKAIKPILRQIKYRIDHEIIAEWGEEASSMLEFRFVEENLDEDLKRAQLQQAYIAMGVKTPEMVAEDLGFDWGKVEDTRESQAEHEAEKAGMMVEAETPKEEAPAVEGKSEAMVEDPMPVPTETELETKLVEHIKKRAAELEALFGEEEE